MEEQFTGRGGQDQPRSGGAVTFTPSSKHNSYLSSAVDKHQQVIGGGVRGEKGARKKCVLVKLQGGLPSQKHVTGDLEVMGRHRPEAHQRNLKGRSIGGGGHDLSCARRRLM